MSDTLPPRPTFSNGQYIGASDLNAAVDYARDETQRVALSGRTWGIATGLALVERTSATGAIQMFIEPGIAWDGYGRPVVVINPAPVTPDLFAALGSGNQTVWLRYLATDTQAIAPGFQTCGVGDPTTRVAESYAIATGSPTAAQRTDGVTISGVKVPDPRDMLIAVDTAAPVVLDGSAPHQNFPDDTANWLIPVGIAAYTAGAPGSFSARTPDQLVQDRIARRYVGGVGEDLFAADGVLRLRDRQTEQDPGSTDDAMAARLAIQTGDIAADAAGRIIGNELVWVEGNMRVTGNARLFGTRLELRDSTGAEAGGAPEFLRRGVSPNNTLGGQDLQICIGSTFGTAGVDRLAIGIVEAPSAGYPDGLLDERMVVRTDGRVAIGTNVIDNYSTLANTLVLATAADTGITVVSQAAKTGNLFFASGITKNAQNAGFVSYDHAAQQLSIGAGSTAVAVVTGGGQFVIGTADLTTLQPDASQLVVASSGGPAGLTIAAAQDTFGLIDFADGTVSPNAGFIRYDIVPERMTFGTNSQGQVFIDKNGQVGIGTNAPSVPLEITSQTDQHALLLDLTSIQAVYGGGHSPLVLQGPGGAVGVGLLQPSATMHVHSGAGDTQMILDDGNGTTTLFAQAGSVGIGGQPGTNFDVSASVAATTSAPTNHLALLKNTATGAANVLALKVDGSTVSQTAAIPACNWLTLFDGADNPLGAFETASAQDGFGNYYAGVTFTTNWAADYAEAVPRAPGIPPIGPGRVVGVRAGVASQVTDGADAVFVTTDRPAVLGNAPPRGKRDAYELLAFIGQVAVLVAGPVNAGDLIVASGNADGVGRAVAPDAVQSADLPMIVGRAWAAADGAAPSRVNALVGPGVASAAATGALLARQAEEVARQSQELARLAQAVELQSLEVERQSAAIELQSKENTRLAQEVERLSQAAALQSQEVERQGQEIVRQSQVIELQAKELTRQSQVDERQSRENARQSKEIARLAALLADDGPADAV